MPCRLPRPDRASRHRHRRHPPAQLLQPRRYRALLARCRYPHSRENPLERVVERAERRAPGRGRAITRVAAGGGLVWVGRKRGVVVVVELVEWIVEVWLGNGRGGL